MPKKETIQLRSVAAVSEGENLVVRLKIFNPLARTVHAYGTPRRILYDNGTGKLTLCLHDQHVDENSLISLHLRKPKFVPLEGNAETELKITLPGLIKRLKSAAERGGSGPIAEQLRISEAKEIHLEIAYNETPFYENPKADSARQLKEWGRTIAKAKFRVAGREDSESEESAPA